MQIVEMSSPKNEWKGYALVTPSTLALEEVFGRHLSHKSYT